MINFNQRRNICCTFFTILLKAYNAFLLLTHSFILRRRQLPSIEEAWNMPISAELSSRQQQQQQQQQPGAPGYKYPGGPSGPPPPYPQGQNPNIVNKRFKVGMSCSSSSLSRRDWWAEGSGLSRLRGV